MMKIRNNLSLAVHMYSISVGGRTPSGKTGFWIIKRNKRVFQLEPVIVKKFLTTKEIIKIIKEL